MPPAVKTTRTVQRGVPDFVRAINDDYSAQISHTFILYGNIYDYVDNAGNELSCKKVLASLMDDNIQKGLNPNAVSSNKESGVQSCRAVSEKTRILALYNTSTGLEFPDSKSKAMWTTAIKQVLGEEAMEELGGDNYFKPGSVDSAMALFSQWFGFSKQLKKANDERRELGQPMQKELVFTLVLTDADTLVPRGDIANMGADRSAIVNLRNWAQDVEIGHRNRIILMTRHLMDIHESIRCELAVSHPVRKPNLIDRTEWLTCFNANIKNLVAAKGPQESGDNKNVCQIDFAPDFTLTEFAQQSAGMNRRQIKDVILNSWRNQTPIDFPQVQERKKRALDEEYGGIIDIKEPTFGFEQIGGHEHFKQYCRLKIIRPLKAGNRRRCSRGALMTGPPGTGKSMVAWALAKEAGVNFIQVDIGKAFGGLVGESEKNMRKIVEALEAAAPCVAFFDEIDSVMSSGRSSAGDSGTSGRVFNNFMTWLSDPGRVGKVVALMATNRPDLLDSALIRAGRIDAKIPMLAPQRGDAKGRWAILTALTRKNKVVWSPGLEATRTDKNKGLGRFLFDEERVWTGAEAEQLLMAALDEADFAVREVNGKQDYTVTLEDWDAAFENIIPNTEEVERQTNLALLYVDNLRYVPAEWRELAKDKKGLKEACELAKAA